MQKSYPREEVSSIFGPIIQRKGEIDDDVAHHLGTGWVKWRLATEVMCNKKCSQGLRVSSLE